MTSYFTQPADLAPGTKARSADINAIAQAITVAFNKLPDPNALNAGTLAYAQNTGVVANTYLASLPKIITNAYIDGMQVRLLPGIANTGASTLNVNGLGNIAIKRYDGTAAQAGDILPNGPLNVVYIAAINAFVMPPVANAEVIAAAASAATATQAASAAGSSASTAASQAQVATTQAQSASTSATSAAGSATSAASSAAAAQAAAQQSGAGQVQSDWASADSTSKAFIKNKPSLAAVATSGNKADIGLSNVENKSSTQIRADLTSANITTALGYAASRGAAFANNVPDRALAADDVRAFTNPITTIGYAKGMRVRFGLMDDATAPTYADVIDLSSWTDSSGGGINSLYFSKSSQSISHKYAAAGSTAWSAARFLAYADGYGASGTWGINIIGNAGNTSSCTNATNTAHTWNVVQYFNTNRNGSAVTSGGGNTSGLIVQGGNGGPACLSFLREGSYGVNFGLDSDAHVRLGGWSAGNMFDWNMLNGDFVATGNVTAYSDERLKADWRDVSDNFVSRWAAIKHGVYRRMDTGVIQVGLSAQSVQELLPEAVVEDQHGMLSLNYGGAAAVATVQLAQELVALRQIVTRQQAQIQSLIEKASGQ